MKIDKKKIIEKVKEILKQKEITLKTDIDEVTKTISEYGPPKDRCDSFRNQLVQKKEMLTSQLRIIEEDFKVLEEIDLTKTYNSVEFGSVVITPIRCFFIAVSAGKFNFENREFFAISVQVPIYKSMQGKKKGDTFVFNNIKYLIEDIF